jgi:hypothetical protein
LRQGRLRRGITIDPSSRRGAWLCCRRSNTRRGLPLRRSRFYFAASPAPRAPRRDRRCRAAGLSSCNKIGLGASVRLVDLPVRGAKKRTPFERPARNTSSVPSARPARHRSDINANPRFVVVTFWIACVYKLEKSGTLSFWPFSCSARAPPRLDPCLATADSNSLALGQFFNGGSVADFPGPISSFFYTLVKTKAGPEFFLREAHWYRVALSTQLHGHRRPSRRA